MCPEIKFIIGHTADLETRLKRHNGLLPNKATAFTNRQSGLWHLVYYEEFKTREEAFCRERELKTARGRLFIRDIINSKYTRRP